MNSGNNIGELIPLIILIALVVGVLAVGILASRKAEKVGRELVNDNFNDLRLINNCTLSDALFPDFGIIALLPDRMLFVSTLFNKRREIPLAQITALTLPKLVNIPNRSQTRQFIIHLDRKKIKISMNMFVMNAWVVALQKSAPALAIAGLTPGMK